MENFVCVTIFRVLLFFTVISSSIGLNVDITQSNDEGCLGTAVTFTCTVNGTTLGWRYSRAGTLPEIYLAPSGSTTLRLFDSTPFSTRITDVSDGIITSIATSSYLTRDADRMTLECSNGSFSSGTTEIASVTLPLQDTSVAASVNRQFDPVSGQINVTWSRATCTSVYRIIVIGILNDTDTVNGTSFSYTPKSSGTYSFQINSINYLGDEIRGIASIPYLWLVPSTIVHINVNNSGVIFTFEDNDNDERPPVTGCNIIFNNISRDCIQLNKPYIFPIRDGVNYTYNVTLRNVVGSASKAGRLQDLIRPTTVTIDVSVTHLQTVTMTVTTGFLGTGSPGVFALPFIVLGVLIALSVCWIVLRICWKKQCCCPRIWRSSFWLILFCYDCCTYDAGEKGGRKAIGLKNPNAGEEKGADTSL